MNKVIKYLSLFFIIFFIVLFIFYKFSSHIETTPIEGAIMDGSGNSWLYIFVAWLPVIIVVALFYVPVLIILKKYKSIFERIAVSLEKISEK